MLRYVLYRRRVMLYRVKFGKFRRNYRPSLVRRLETLHILQPISLPVTPLFPLSSWLIALSRVARITTPLSSSSSSSRPHYHRTNYPFSTALRFGALRDFFETLEFYTRSSILSIPACQLGRENFSRHSPFMIENDINFWIGFESSSRYREVLE